MSQVLVTGGAGSLGRELVPRLQKAGHAVRVLSRSPRPAQLAPDLEWAVGDIATGAGLSEAVAGVVTIIHAASSPGRRTQQVDVDGTRLTLQVAQFAGVRHFIHVSIVGIERIPYPYYQAKVQGEAEVRAGGVPYTILRATQFHSLIDGMFLAPYRNLPLGFIPTDFKFQTIDTGEVADRLTQLAVQTPAGLLPDMGGPQVLTLGELADQWFAAQGKRFWTLPLYLPGGFPNGFRQGYNTCPDHRDGKITWAEWLQLKYRR